MQWTENYAYDEDGQCINGTFIEKHFGINLHKQKSALPIRTRQAKITIKQHMLIVDHKSI